MELSRFDKGFNSDIDFTGFIIRVGALFHIEVLGKLSLFKVRYLKF